MTRFLIRGPMTKESKTEERHDRDIVRARDAHDATVRNIRKYLKWPVLAKEAGGSPYETSSALREHANLADHEEHPYRRLIRELREKRGH